MGRRSVRLDLGDRSVFAAVALRPHQVADRAHRVAALIEAMHPSAHIAGGNFAPFADGRYGRDRLVASDFSFCDQKPDSEIGGFGDCSCFRCLP